MDFGSIAGALDGPFAPIVKSMLGMMALGSAVLSVDFNWSQPPI